MLVDLEAPLLRPLLMPVDLEAPSAQSSTLRTKKMKVWVKNEKVRSINVQATTVVCTPFAERGNIHGKHSFSAGSCFVRRAFASGDLRHDARQHRRSLKILRGTVVPSGRRPYRGSTSYCSLYLSLWMNCVKKKRFTGPVDWNPELEDVRKQRRKTDSR